MVESADAPRNSTLLALPLELRLLIYTHLTAPALAHNDIDYNCRTRLFYHSMHATSLPESKVIYFALHALSASCSTLHAEMKVPIAQVRPVLEKQKYYLQKRMLIIEFDLMKSNPMTWQELERLRGIALGPDFTGGWEDLDVTGEDGLDGYPELGIYQLAMAKRWQKFMRDEKDGKE